MNRHYNLYIYSLCKTNIEPWWKHIILFAADKLGFLLFRFINVKSDPKINQRVRIKISGSKLRSDEENQSSQIPLCLVDPHLSPVSFKYVRLCDCQSAEPCENEMLCPPHHPPSGVRSWYDPLQQQNQCEELILVSSLKVSHLSGSQSDSLSLSPAPHPGSDRAQSWTRTWWPCTRGSVATVAVSSFLWLSLRESTGTLFSGLRSLCRKNASCKYLRFDSRLNKSAKNLICKVKPAAWSV